MQYSDERIFLSFSREALLCLGLRDFFWALEGCGFRTFRVLGLRSNAPFQVEHSGVPRAHHEQVKFSFAPSHLKPTKSEPAKTIQSISQAQPVNPFCCCGYGYFSWRGSRRNSCSLEADARRTVKQRACVLMGFFAR